MEVQKVLLRVLLGFAVIVAPLFVLSRVVFPEAFGIWAETIVGRLFDQAGAAVVQTLFGPGAPFAPLMEATDRFVGFVRVQLTTGNLVSAILGALGVGVFNLLYNWWRNRSIRRMCSAMLYSAGYR